MAAARIKRRTMSTQPPHPLHRPLLLLFFIIFVSCWIQSCQASMVVEIPPGDRHCFFVRVPNDRPSVINGNYDVLDDEMDHDAVSAWLEKQSEERHRGVTVWRSEEHEGEATFSISVDPVGKYALCLRATLDTDDDDAAVPEVVPVGLSLRVAPAQARSLEEGVLGPDAERALELVQSAGFVENDWRNFVDHFDYLRNREATHTVLMHQIRDRVLGWTVVEAILVITMAVAQILYWKRFFETKRYL